MIMNYFVNAPYLWDNEIMPLLCIREMESSRDDLQSRLRFLKGIMYGILFSIPSWIIILRIISSIS
jgi:hypothetical protein